MARCGPRPEALHVADFTYVPMVIGFGYTAFVIDAYAGLIAGWECSLTKNTAFVERAIRAAAARRAREGHPLTGDTVHHGDAGSQYTAIHFTDTPMLAGLIPSVGTVGDALDDALAETTIGLYKTECVRDGARSATGRCARWPTWRTSPPRGCIGTTPAGSCTAWADAHRQKPKPSTTLTKRPDSTPITRNEVCMNPFGNTHLAAGCVHVSDGIPGHRLPKADVTSVSAIDGALVVAQGPVDVVHCLLASFCLGVCGCGGRTGGHASHDQDHSRSGDIAKQVDVAVHFVYLHRSRDHAACQRGLAIV